MRTEQIQLYKFDELSEEAKEKARENMRTDEGYLAYDWWDFLFEDFKTELKEIGVEAETFSFDFYRDKYLTAENLYVEDEEKLLKSCSNKWLVLNELRKEKTIITDISLNEEGEAEVEIDFYDEDNLTEKEYDERIEEKEELEGEITSFIQDKLSNFLSRLEEEYEYLLSDEAVDDYLISNEWEFKKDGTQF